ncbi:MAG: hypothetical protein Q8P17_04040 [bacterium]|nr:hypothetical protein [bacterium]
MNLLLFLNYKDCRKKVVEWHKVKLEWHVDQLLDIDPISRAELARTKAMVELRGPYGNRPHIIAIGFSIAGRARFREFK